MKREDISDKDEGQPRASCVMKPTFLSAIAAIIRVKSHTCATICASHFAYYHHVNINLKCKLRFLRQIFKIRMFPTNTVLLCCVIKMLQ